jgi:HD-GYP domain-containing protein (c-di-GMP phosphodiesterase class II)
VSKSNQNSAPQAPSPAQAAGLTQNPAAWDIFTRLLIHLDVCTKASDQIKEVYAEIKESLLGLVHCLATLIDAKDSCTAGHSERVSRIAVRVGRSAVSFHLPERDPLIAAAG